MISLDLINEFDFIKSITNPDDGHIYDCYGIKYEKNLLFTKEAHKILSKSTQHGVLKIPQISAKWGEELFENLFLLACIKKASIKKEKFVFVELGAGYGRYSARACAGYGRYSTRAWKFSRKKNFKILSVEADPYHYRMMLKHLKNNGIQSQNIEVYQNIISNTNSFINFYISSKDLRKISNETAQTWFGQSIVHDWEKKINPVINLLKNVIFYINNFYKVPFFKFIQFYTSGFSSIKVKSISLNKLLQNEKKVSLIDMDIQGEEINLIKSEIETLNKKVEKMYVATHSKKIEEDIIQFLGKKNWQLTTYLKGETINKTKFGPIKCQDGVQIWENKNFF